MTRLFRTGPLTLSAIALAFPAWADFTAQEYWDYTLKSARDQGAEISAKDVTTTPDGLVINGLSLEGEEDGDTFSFVMESYTLNNHPDGGIELLLPESQTLTMMFDSPDTEPAIVEFTLSQTNFTALATGELAALDSVASADEIRLELSSFSVGGAPIDASAELSLSQMHLVSEGATLDYDMPFVHKLDAATVDMSFDFSLPEAGVSSSATNSMRDLSANIHTSPTEDPENSALLVEFTASSSRSETRQASPDTGDIQYAATTGQVAYNAVFQDEIGAFSSAVSDVQVEANLQRLPIGPILAEATVLSAEVGFPMTPAEDAQEAALTFDVQGLKISENIWRMVDPAAAIPRDPISLTLELDGDLIVSPAASDELPFDVAPAALRIETLFAAIGGATLAGSGAFAFDPSDFPLVPGQPPTPEGAIDLSLTGGLELLERLTTGGIVSSEQAMGVQMMIGMMMREGPGGALETQIKTGADGSISVNGNRLR